MKEILERKNVTLEQLLPPMYQLRKKTTPDKEFIQSVSTHGIRKNLDVRNTNQKDKYQIVDGYRRYCAAGWIKQNENRVIPIPVAISDMTDEEALTIALTDNIQLQNMTPTEEAGAFQLYLTEKKYGSISKLAKTISRNRDYIYERLKLLKAPEAKDKGLPTSIVAEIARVEDKKEQAALTKAITMKRTKKEPLSLKQVRSAVTRLKEGVPVNPDNIPSTEEIVEYIIIEVTKCPACNTPAPEGLKTIYVCAACAEKVVPQKTEEVKPNKEDAKRVNPLKVVKQ